MKTICWNGGIEIKAENEQDASYLQEFISRMEHKDVMSGYIDLDMGEFDHDGEMSWSHPMFLSEFEKNEDKDCNVTYVETDLNKHEGKEGKVVGINFNSFFDYSLKTLKEIINKK